MEICVKIFQIVKNCKFIFLNNLRICTKCLCEPKTKQISGLPMTKTLSDCRIPWSAKHFLWKISDIAAQNKTFQSGAPNISNMTPTLSCALKQIQSAQLNGTEFAFVLKSSVPSYLLGRQFPLPTSCFLVSYAACSRVWGENLGPANRLRRRLRVSLYDSYMTFPYFKARWRAKWSRQMNLNVF